MSKSTFQLEITLENGQITQIQPVKGNKLYVSETVPSLDKLPESVRREMTQSMKHGSMLLIGQNSPAWLVFTVAGGYIQIQVPGVP